MHSVTLTGHPVSMLTPAPAVGTAKLFGASAACSNPHALYPHSMTQAVAHILEEAEQLSVSERAELADRIVESLAHNIPSDIAAAQVTEVRRRIAEVEAGEVSLIPGDEALARVRQLVASARAAS
jgi:putative addiction module component (TIGR02574 family)